jgi:hypothetical protein
MQGDAIAFALGANARMLRVKTLSGVLSTSPGEDGEPTSKAEVPFRNTASSTRQKSTKILSLPCYIHLH